MIERSVYEPYGALVNRPLKDGPGYAGHVADAGTGLSYMQQRYYSPEAGTFLSVDTVEARSSDQRLFNRYAYAFNNPYVFKDPDGRCPVCAVLVFFVVAMTHSDPANAPAPGGKIESTSPADAISDAVPGGKAVGQLKSVAHMAEKLTQRAASREAKRDSKIPVSQQPTAQTNGRAPDGTPLGGNRAMMSLSKEVGRRPKLCRCLAIRAEPMLG